MKGLQTVIDRDNGNQRQPSRDITLEIGRGYGIGAISGLLVSASALKQTPVLDWAPIDPMVLFLVAGIGFALFAKPIFWPSLPVGSVVILFFGCLSFGLIFASNWTKVLYVFILVPVLLYLAAAAGHSKSGVRGFIDSNTVVALVTGFALLLFSEPFGLDGRITVVGSNPIDITKALTFGVVCIGFRIFNGGQSRIGLAGSVLIAIFLIYCALQTGSRGPWIGLIICLLLMLVASKQRIYLVGGVLTVASLVAIFWPLGVRELFVDTPLFSRLYGFGDVDDFTTGRDTLSGLAMEGIRQNPLGIGWGSFGEFAAMRGQSGVSYPHNIFLEIGVEAGHVGLVGFLILIAAVLYFSISRFGASFSAVGLVCFVYWLVVSFFSSDVGGNRGLWISAGIALGVFMSLQRRDCSAISTPYRSRGPHRQR